LGDEALGDPHVSGLAAGVDVELSIMAKSFAKRVCNRLLHQLARFLPGATSLRPFLHRLRGVKIQGKVFIGDDVYLENEYPECVEIHEGAQIGLRSTIIAHTRGRSNIVVGKGVFIGANCVIAAQSGKTLNIGEGSVIAIASLVTSDIPPFTFYSSEKAKPIARVTVPFTCETSYDQFLRGLRPISRNSRRV
jgi:serine acetyltransferase